MGWGNFLDQLFKKLPIQDRKERWRNELVSIEKEKNELLKLPSTPKRADRLVRLITHKYQLIELLKNAT